MQIFPKNKLKLREKSVSPYANVNNHKFHIMSIDLR